MWGEIIKIVIIRRMINDYLLSINVIKGRTGSEIFTGIPSRLHNRLPPKNMAYFSRRDRGKRSLVMGPGMT